MLLKNLLYKVGTKDCKLELLRFCLSLNFFQFMQGKNLHYEITCHVTERKH